MIARARTWIACTLVGHAVNAAFSRPARAFPPDARGAFIRASVAIARRIMPRAAGGAS